VNQGKKEDFPQKLENRLKRGVLAGEFGLVILWKTNRESLLLPTYSFLRA
jgi:hypothetical protein